jgi:bacillithiol biosynthesis deacetylase BshB1
MRPVDVLAFGAHPDDVEIGCGGTLLRLTDAGKRVAVVDLVRGELGTRGSSEIRAREAAASSEILGLVGRENLELPDGHIRADPEAKRRVVDVIRRWRPEAVFLPYWLDRHPDHAHASTLIYEGTFLAGLPRYEPGERSHRPTRLYYFMGWTEFEPTFTVDVTDQFDRKMEAIYAFSTQFRPEASSDSETRLTAATTDWRIRSRMAYYGSLIDARYGEGFLIRGRLRVEDPLSMDFMTF